DTIHWLPVPGRLQKQRDFLLYLFSISNHRPREDWQLSWAYPKILLPGNRSCHLPVLRENSENIHYRLFQTEYLFHSFLLPQYSWVVAGRAVNAAPER